MHPCCMLCEAVVGMGVWLLAGSKHLGGVVPDVLERKWCAWRRPCVPQLWLLLPLNTNG